MPGTISYTYQRLMEHKGSQTVGINKKGKTMTVIYMALLICRKTLSTSDFYDFSVQHVLSNFCVKATPSVFSFGPSFSLSK